MKTHSMHCRATCLVKMKMILDKKSILRAEFLQASELLRKRVASEVSKMMPQMVKRRSSLASRLSLNLAKERKQVLEPQLQRSHQIALSVLSYQMNKE